MGMYVFDRLIVENYINDKNSKLFKETGTFFAFSSEQFKEQMKKYPLHWQT